MIVVQRTFENPHLQFIAGMGFCYLACSFISRNLNDNLFILFTGVLMINARLRLNLPTGFFYGFMVACLVDHVFPMHNYLPKLELNA